MSRDPLLPGFANPQRASRESPSLYRYREGGYQTIPTEKIGRKSPRRPQKKQRPAVDIAPLLANPQLRVTTK